LYFISCSHTTNTEEKCLICNCAIKEGENATILTEKGSDSIKSASQCRGESLCVDPSQIVHEQCRRQYVHPFYIKKDILKRKQENDQSAKDATPSKLRPKQSFSFKEHCLLCGQIIKMGSREKFHFVRTFEFQNTLVEER
jgi:hypothetical protein